MGYMHIENLYKNQDILLFRQAYALEKVHGTGAHVSWNSGELRSVASEECEEGFQRLFDQCALTEKFKALGHEKVTVYGEACGANVARMRLTYGRQLRFVVFDVKIGDCWLNVPNMAQVAERLGFEVVPWEITSTDIPALDAIRDRPSEVAERWGCGSSRPREGIILRPLVELRKNNGERIICKHKARAFSETTSPREVADPSKLLVLEEAGAVAQEWVTEMRLTHVLDKLGSISQIEQTPLVIRAMVEDVYREAIGEIIESDAVRKAIGKRTAQLYRKRLQDSEQ